MPTIQRPRRPVPRRVSNDVGAAVTAPVRWYEPGEWIPVTVWVGWDQELAAAVDALAFGHTGEHVGVRVRDPVTGLRYDAWVRASDVSRR